MYINYTSIKKKNSQKVRREGNFSPFWCFSGSTERTQQEWLSCKRWLCMVRMSPGRFVSCNTCTIRWGCCWGRGCWHCVGAGACGKALCFLPTSFIEIELTLSLVWVQGASHVNVIHLYCNMMATIALANTSVASHNHYHFFLFKNVFIFIYLCDFTGS